MQGAKKDFLITFVVLVLIIIVSSPVIKDINDQILNTDIKFKESKKLPSKVKYKASPFLFDNVGYTTLADAIYKADDLSINGNADFTNRLILEKGTVLMVQAHLKSDDSIPRVWLYSSEGKLISPGTYKKIDGAHYWKFQIYDFDLYRLRAQFEYENVLDIAYFIKVQEEDLSKEKMIKRYFDKSLKTFEIKLDFSQLHSYRKLKSKQEENWSRPIAVGQKHKSHKAPKGRVVARIKAPGGHWSLASIGLAGRGEVHGNDDFSSLDIKIISGELLYGLTKFKLYTLKSKNYLRDFVFENLLRDQGAFSPRQDIVKVKINGKDYGYMELLEGIDSQMFEYAQRQEGAIIGYDVDKILNNPEKSRLKTKSYFKKKMYKTPDMSSPSFARDLCDDSIANTLSFNMGIAGFHGMGQSDLKFHVNKRRDCIDVIVRDTNSVLPVIASMIPRIFSAMMIHLAQFVPNWRPTAASLSANFVFMNEEGVQDIDYDFDWWHATPAILNYLSDEKNLTKVNKFNKLWDQEWMKEREAQRFDNTFQVVRLNKKSFNEAELPEIYHSLNLALFAIDEMPKAYDDNFKMNTDSYLLRKYIETTSQNKVKISDYSLRSLNWRNYYVEKFSREQKKEQTIDMGEELDYANLIKFLYRDDKEDKTYVFFILRNVQDDDFEFELEEVNSASIIKPYSIKSFGSQKINLEKSDIALNRISAEEKLKILAFEIPKLTRNQYFKPKIKGSATYWGIREYWILPKYQTEEEQSIPSIDRNYFNVSGKTITLKNNNVSVNESLFVPKGYTLKISRDSKIDFAENTCLLVEGELDVDDNAFLTLYSNTGSWQGAHFFGVKKIQNIEVSDLGTGVYGVECFNTAYSGGFSVYDSNLVFKNIIVRKSKVEDSVHFLNSQVYMKNILVEGAQSDSIDADFCTLNVENIKLADAGSDGLDVSGSYALVQKSLFQNNSDKGISVGENSTLAAIENVLDSCTLGIAVKDSSFAKLQYNIFENNDYGLVYYAKKPYFSIPAIREKEVLKNNKFTGNNVNIKNLKFNLK